MFIHCSFNSVIKTKNKADSVRFVNELFKWIILLPRWTDSKDPTQKNDSDIRSTWYPMLLVSIKS